MMSRLTRLSANRRADKTARNRLPPALLHRWAALTPRERRLLGLAAGIALLALLWTVGVKPALETIEKQSLNLPSLRAQAAEIDGLILQAQTLQRRRPANIDASDMPDALRDSLVRSGIDSSGVRITALTDSDASTLRKWEIAIDSARADVLMKWLGAIPALLNVHVESLDVKRGQHDGRDRPGEVNGRIVLEAAREAVR